MFILNKTMCFRYHSVLLYIQISKYIDQAILPSFHHKAKSICRENNLLYRWKVITFWEDEVNLSLIKSHPLSKINELQAFECVFSEKVATQFLGAFITIPPRFSRLRFTSQIIIFERIFRLLKSKTVRM